MKKVKIKHTNLHLMTINQFRDIIEGKQFREFIQFLIKENNKGENGLIVKSILDRYKKEETIYIEHIIEEFNATSDNREQWRKPTIEFFNKFCIDFQNNFEKSKSERDLVGLFILFTMNYIFTCYANKKFRKFVDVKVGRLFG
ncbi:hypothetical protein [Metabacillus niabensis]|uniref:hypothetical protein n=1 Tax=Metabacillus niabensis TaxID=324854 RepID=UPI001CF9E989|nr:hypothetical protein [Metabacillus niabensis]